METRAHHLLVGSIVLALIAGLVAFGVWLAQMRIADDTQRYVIYFSGSVTGLQVGSPVRFRGIQVGQVVDLQIDPRNLEQVRVVIEVPEETPIKTDATATLQYQGITGAQYVQILGSTQEAPLLREVADGIPVIPSAPSPFEEVIDTAPELLTSVNDLVLRANRLLSDENIVAVSEIIENARAASGDMRELTGDLRRVSDEIGELLAGLDVYAATVTDSLDATLSTARSTMEGLEEEVDATAAEVRELANSYDRVAGELRSFIQENAEAITNFTQTGLGDLTQLAVELRDLSSSLSRISNAIEQNPAGFLFGGGSSGVPLD